ncbi:glycine zipper domain-containing protein [Salidesulfovibrio brasiliensis]|uniref:glycine zipper domain-containing protein n=1 Tax=Salidesulfovibrio brasiliensis TaxID=221711 RepID=UPI0006CF2D28|nr:glycine zipper domain-containing protein [Salidesulfovibrio brasiliensis]
MTRFITLILLATLLLPGCANKAQNAAGIGALVGSTIGALTFKNKVSGAAIGAGAGLLVGYIVGNEMDKYDRNQVSHALETTPSGRTHEWRNPDTGVHYRAEPRPAYSNHQRIERDVELTARFPDGRHETVHATAYRAEDGTWRLVQ